MSVTESVARQSVKRPPARAREATWVYESNLDGPRPRGAATIAAKCRGAEDDHCNGADGKNYAIPTRNRENKLLEWDEIKSHVQAFLDHAKEHPDEKFRILPSPERKTEEEHERFVDLFYNAPKNCELPGRWLERLGRLHAVRLILLDANIRIDEEARKCALDQYFAANEGLWNAEYIELVSLGSAKSLVANDNYAKGRGYRHRIMNVDADVYGDYTAQVREHLSVAYATKLACMNDPTGTSTGNQVGAIHLAACAGLQIDELLMQ